MAAHDSDDEMPPLEYADPDEVVQTAYAPWGEGRSFHGPWPKEEYAGMATEQRFVLYDLEPRVH